MWKVIKDRTRRSRGFCPCPHIRSCLESVELHTKTNNAHAWTHGRGVMRHGRRIKAGCVKSHNRHMQFVQTLSSVVHARKGRKPRLRRVRPTSNNSAILLLLKLLLCRRKHQLNTVQLVYFRSTRIIIDSHNIGIRMIMSDSLYNSLTHNMVW